MPIVLALRSWAAVFRQPDHPSICDISGHRASEREPGDWENGPVTGPVTGQAAQTRYSAAGQTDEVRADDHGAVHGRPTVIAVVGPTAVGKSDLAVALARAVGGEVVNADS